MAVAAFGQALSLVTDDTYPRSTPEGTGFEDLILKEAFGRIGLSVKIAFLPSERTLINVNKGIDDGMFVRLAGVEAEYPNLVMVPESICEYEFAAFGADKSLAVDGYESLWPYRVAIIRGWRHPEANLAGARRLVRVKDDDALFAMLEHGRVDAIVYESLEGRMRIRRLGIEGVYQLGPPLATIDMYLYLNARHKDLVPGLVSALQAMKADGTWSRIVDTVTGGP